MLYDGSMMDVESLPVSHLSFCQYFGSVGFSKETYLTFGLGTVDTGQPSWLAMVWET